MIERRVALRGPLDLATTLGPLAHGRGDRTIRLAGGQAWLAFRTADGPATLCLVMAAPSRLTATAWGDGAEKALGTVPALIGEEDRPEDFVAHHRVLREAAATAEEAGRRLRSLPGIGPWTVAEVLRCAFGDPDAVSVGDFHIPNSVAWALAGEARANDERMLELLEPYRGQRGRVQRLLEVGRVLAPRYGPRMAPRNIAAL